MGQQRLRKWILNNEFFQYRGGFSKSAFIMMTTWFTVMTKFVFSGLSTKISIAERVVKGTVVPAVNWEWVIKFDSGEAMAILSLVFGLYFGGKFSPDGKKNGENGERRDIRSEEGK
jgi:hypothetical protein